MAHMVHKGLCVVLLLFTVGCASASSIRIGLKTYPPKSDTYDTPILSPGDVHAAHLTVIGKIFASREVIISTENVISGVIEMMKEKARRLGADAMINVKIVREFDRVTGSYFIKGNADAVVIELPKGNVEKEVPMIRKPKEYQL